MHTSWFTIVPVTDREAGGEGKSDGGFFINWSLNRDGGGGGVIKLVPWEVGYPLTIRTGGEEVLLTPIQS